MTLLVQVANLLKDPITHQPMQDPVIAPCGHIYERLEIKAYLTPSASQNQPPVMSFCGYTCADSKTTAPKLPDQCPLCKTAITIDSLAPHLLIRKAITIIQRYPSCHTVDEAALTSEDKQTLEKTERYMQERIAKDTAANIPMKLAAPLPSVKQRVV